MLTDVKTHTSQLGCGWCARNTHGGRRRQGKHKKTLLKWKSIVKEQKKRTNTIERKKQLGTGRRRAVREAVPRGGIMSMKGYDIR